MSSKKERKKYVIAAVDGMRAELGASPETIAGAAGLTKALAATVLAGKPATMTSCRKVVGALRKLGHATADETAIVDATAKPAKAA